MFWMLISWSRQPDHTCDDNQTWRLLLRTMMASFSFSCQGQWVQNASVDASYHIRDDPGQQQALLVLVGALLCSSAPSTAQSATDHPQPGQQDQNGFGFEATIRLREWSSRAGRWVASHASSFQHPISKIYSTKLGRRVNDLRIHSLTIRLTAFYPLVKHDGHPIVWHFL
jgi:hypothetical protein